MNELALEIFNICLSKIGPRKTTSGWTSFNAVCCKFNNETNDTRKRGGLRLTPEGGIVYHCFNCGFAAGWQPGRLLSKKFINLLEWFSITQEEIKNLNFKAWKIKENNKTLPTNKEWTSFDFKETSLPKGSKPFSYWIIQETHDENFLNVIQYMSERGEYLLTARDYYWTPDKSHSMNKRVIIPFTWNNKIIGWTARAIFTTKYRYMSDVPANYLFNIDSIKQEQKFIIVCEGPFDAIAVDGVATLGDHISKEQRQWLRSTGKNIIILPDRVKQGGSLVDVAIEEGWFVAFPSWDTDIKDASDASKRYGRLYTLWSVINNRTNNLLAIRTWRQFKLK